MMVSTGRIVRPQLQKSMRVAYSRKDCVNKWLSFLPVCCKWGSSKDYDEVITSDWLGGGMSSDTANDFVTLEDMVQRPEMVFKELVDTIHRMLDDYEEDVKWPFGSLEKILCK